MTEKVLFITDTFKYLNFKKDTSILMIEEALKKEMNVFQCEINDLFVYVSIIGSIIKLLTPGSFSSNCKLLAVFLVETVSKFVIYVSPLFK